MSQGRATQRINEIYVQMKKNGLAQMLQDYEIEILAIKRYLDEEAQRAQKAEPEEKQ